MALAGPRGQAAAAALAPQIFALQRPDGGFRQALSPEGATEDDMARLWGHGRLLVGLVEYYEASGDPRSLEVARRLGDFLVDHAARFNAATVREAFHDGAMAHGYICWTQNVEGLALLARATGEERYRAAALSIADGIERRPGQHAHGWFSSLRGLALLAEDDPALLPDLGRAWQSFADSQDLLWTGGPPEYFAPGIARDEGCASADWLRLNLALWRMTEDERYLLAAENGLFNAFFANQQPNGGFGHLRLSPRGFEYGATEAWWCCTLHGARTFPAIREAAFRAEGDALAYDLPVDGRGEAHGLVVEADAEPARDGRVRFRILEAPPEASRAAHSQTHAHGGAQFHVRLHTRTLANDRAGVAIG
ncbi:MAG: glycoside hydrolase family 127 protein [Bryobacterales bacterium]